MTARDKMGEGAHEHEYGDSGFCVHCGAAGPDADTPEHRKAIAAEQLSGDWLAKGNELLEAGKKESAEKCFAKSEHWLARANKLRRW